MSLLLDTGVLFAYLDARDPHHDTAQAIVAACMDGVHGEVVTSDYVVDELLTLLQARRSPWEGVQAGAQLVGLAGQGSPLATPVEVTREVLQATWPLFERHYADGLSFTDCSHLAVMDQHGIDQLATFDAGFEGLVETVPGQIDAG